MAVTLVVLLIWAPWALNIIYVVTGFVWSLINDLVLWLLPEPYHTAFRGVGVTLNFLTQSADWATGVIPGFGMQAQSLLRFMLYAGGVHFLAEVVYVLVWLSRKIFRRRLSRLEEQGRFAF